MYCNISIKSVKAVRVSKVAPNIQQLKPDKVLVDVNVTSFWVKAETVVLRRLGSEKECLVL